MTDQMTNRNQHVQSASRPFNLLVRGGRLTRFKGQVASIAPGLAVVILATAAVLLTGGVNQVEAQQAVNACGTDEVGQDTITCAAPTGTGPNPYANGITYENSDGLTLILDDPGITVGGSGVTVEGTNTGDISVQMGDGEVITVGADAHGLWATTAGDGAALAQMEGGTVTTQEGNARGLVAEISNADNTATATARLTQGDITTGGEWAYGLVAETAGAGAALAQMDGGTITTREANARGLEARISNADSTATVTARLTKGDIKTDGNWAIGLLAETAGDGAALAEMEGGTVTTQEGNARGLFAWITNAASTATATARLTEGVINTGGEWAYGLLAATAGDGAALAEMEGGTVTTQEGNARGLFALVNNADSTASATARLTEGDIKTDGNWAYGLLARTAGVGAALAKMDGGTVTTSGLHARGLFAHIENTDSTASATARLTEGVINTGGEWAHGLLAQTAGDGAALAEMDGGTVITQEGHARGLFALVNNADSTASATARLTRGEITTSGEDANGLFAENKGLGDALAEMDGGTVITEGSAAHGLLAFSSGGQAVANLGEGAVITVSGAGSDGIRAEGATGFDVDVAGSVTGGVDTGAAIRTISNAGGTIDIDRTATVIAASGLAIQDGDGAANITSAGTITGDIRLGAGDDILTLAGGRVTGAIYGGAGNDTVAVSATTIYEGSYIEADQLRIEAGSVFRASGGASDTLTIAAAVTNNGILSVQDGTAGDVIRIEGDYTGSGTSLFALETDGARTDSVVIDGNASGEMRLSIASVGGADAEGASLVIDVVTVGGTSDGTFTLIEGNHVTSDGEHAVIAGAYLYRLAETAGGWALSALSESGEVNYQPSAPVYDSYGQSLLALNGPTSLRNRGSSEDFRILAWEGGTGDQDSGSPLWLQMGADRITLSEENSTTGAALDSSLWEMEVGADIVVIESGAGLLVGGLMGSYATGSTDVSSAFGDGSIDTTGLGVGVAATWYDTRRFYVDGQMTLASYTSDLSSAGIGTLTEGNGGTGFAVSLEAGQQLDLGSRLKVTPQAQLSLSSVAFDDFTGDAHEEQVTFENASSQQLRLGVELGLQEQEARRLYGIMNLFHEFGAGSEVDAGRTTLTTESEPWAAGVGLGGTYVWNDRLDLFGETSYTTGLGNVGDTSALSVNAGLKVVF